MSDMRIFRRFRSKAEAEQLVSELAEFGAEWRENNAMVDRAFVGDVQEDHHVMLPQDKFADAERVLEAAMERELGEGVPADHYLHGFTDDELLDLLLKQDEWSVYDRQSARNLLAQRGIVLPDKAVEAMRASRNRELEAPAGDQTAFVVAGYMLAILGGLLGAIIGFALNMSKKTLPDGRKVPSYSPRDRSHGFYIYCLGLVMFAVLSILRIRHWLAMN